MRLWHQSLIPLLPRAQLLAQHRECCALRGKGWGRPHSVVNYVFAHSRSRLFAFHEMVMDEMERRGYRVAPVWRDICHRGRNLAPDSKLRRHSFASPIYDEHDDAYLAECLINLRRKGVRIDLPPT